MQLTTCKGQEENNADAEFTKKARNANKSRKVIREEGLERRLPGESTEREARPFLILSQLETRFWGQNYLDVVHGGVRGL